MSSPASELRNRVTGEVVDAAAASVAEWKPETQSDSETPDIEFVANEDTQKETESNEQTESETSDTDANDGDNEEQTEEDEGEQQEDEQEEEQQEQSEEEELEEDEESGDEEPDTKRYVILEDGKPVVVVINNPPRQQPPFPTSITIMFIVVFALIFLDNVCKLCSLMTHDKCLLRMP